MKRVMLALACGLAAFTGAAHAAPRVEADPSKEYRIVPEAGPWMICVHSYTGSNARALAHELVLLIRRRDNLNAYLFDRSEQQRQEQEQFLNSLDPQGSPRRRRVNIEDQCAVLVGGYPDMETARRALDGIKKMPPPENEKLMDRFTVLAPAEEGGRQGELKGTFLNPFLTSFVTRNPTLPHEAKQVDKANDPFLKRLNADEDYSLLKCKQPFTLAVKEYPGTSVIQAGSSAQSGSFLSMLGLGSKSGDVLSASAMTAHNLAEVLRKMKFDAYVLHTRHSSVVTIGGFDGEDDKRLQETYQRLQLLVQNNIKANKTDTLQLMPQPILMRVPRP